MTLEEILTQQFEETSYGFLELRMHHLYQPNGIALGHPLKTHRIEMKVNGLTVAGDGETLESAMTTAVDRLGRVLL